eukprot:423255-Heterocapsa_arctica.AAC.1
MGPRAPCQGCPWRGGGPMVPTCLCRSCSARLSVVSWCPAHRAPQSAPGSRCRGGCRCSILWRPSWGIS